MLMVGLLRLALLAPAAVAAAAAGEGPSALAAALAEAREDVLTHVAAVEAHIAAQAPPPGSIGAYLLGNSVFRKAATFSIFNTTFLNEDITNAVSACPKSRHRPDWHTWKQQSCGAS